MRNLENFKQTVESPNSGKSKKLKFDGLSLSKKHILSAKKHYIQSIYLILLSTTCVKIYQMTYVIFETISHFSGHNSTVFFPDFPLLALKFIKFLMSIFIQKVSFFFQYLDHFSSAMRDNSSLLFQLKHYMLLTKVALHQSVNFKTCHSLH